jgi:hypothetical protein
MRRSMFRIIFLFLSDVGADGFGEAEWADIYGASIRAIEEMEHKRTDVPTMPT